MLVHYAKIRFHSGEEIQKFFDNKEQIESFEQAMSSDARFIKIDGDLYAISSISAVNFGSIEKEVKLYEELSDTNKKKIDENPNAFPLYQIIKTLGNSNK